ncbi:hypothetical protein ANN_11071 [Periplaneta americana]|uniref:Uncharacterized protein n=1 Tax=Periplaneta americana TaxID=6978 RepID=A0ABQ8T405_PERAM|nr:hypothetical protein ANN_11071 [Periplaneta americana]
MAGLCEGGNAPPIVALALLTLCCLVCAKPRHAGKNRGSVEEFLSRCRNDGSGCCPWSFQVWHEQITGLESSINIGLKSHQIRIPHLCHWSAVHHGYTLHVCRHVLVKHARICGILVPLMYVCDSRKKPSMAGDRFDVTQTQVMPYFRDGDDNERGIVGSVNGMKRAGHQEDTHFRGTVRSLNQIRHESLCFVLEGGILTISATGIR